MEYPSLEVLKMYLDKSRSNFKVNPALVGENRVALDDFLCFV